MNNPILQAWLTGCASIRLIEHNQDSSMPLYQGVAFIWKRPDGTWIEKVIWSSDIAMVCNRLYRADGFRLSESYVPIELTFAECKTALDTEFDVIKDKLVSHE